ncbi:MAG TPA: STAS domain-containing protein [Bryobacteraceae bacterium]|nr:STAS domain-containing protein [Bryobacteraceae bacterium]
MTPVWPFSKATTESPDEEVRVVCQQNGQECEVSLSGRITIDSSPDLRTHLLSRLDSPNCQTLTLDLQDVEYIDVSGLAILVELLRAAEIQRKTLELSRLGQHPRYLLEATHLLHLFHRVNPETPQVHPQ